MLTNLFTAAAETADAAATTTVQSSGMLEMIIMIVAMVAIMYFLMIRPQKKKEKKVKEMLDALKPGDRICTIGGLYGTVAALKDNDVHVKFGSAQNTVVIARWAVRSVEDAPLENDVEPEL